MKRYSIVRVDDNYGPCVLEKVPMCKTDELCYSGKCPYRYGDTKEQLIAKVETAIRRLQADKNRIIVGYDMWAKFIVEFLGVEDEDEDKNK